MREDGFNPAYFLLNRGAKLPDYLAKATNHYANLFELPVLFYVACLILYAGNKADMFYLTLLWLFFGFRYAHAFIHTTYNNLKHRRFAFLGGTVVLAVLWCQMSWWPYQLNRYLREKIPKITIPFFMRFVAIDPYV